MSKKKSGLSDTQKLLVDTLYFAGYDDLDIIETVLTLVEDEEGMITMIKYVVEHKTSVGEVIQLALSLSGGPTYSYKNTFEVIKGDKKQKKRINRLSKVLIMG